MGAEFGFRPKGNYTPTPAAGGLTTLEERSRYADALAKLGELRTFVDLAWINAERMSRDEACRRLLILPRTKDLNAVIGLVEEAIDGAPAMPATVDMLVSALIEVVPLPRPVRKAEYIAAAKSSLDIPAPLIAGLFRSMVRTARAAPSIAEILDEAALERQRLSAVIHQVDVIRDLRREAVISFDWSDADDLEFLAKVGDRVPDTWRSIEW